MSILIKPARKVVAYNTILDHLLLISPSFCHNFSIPYNFSTLIVCSDTWPHLEVVRDHLKNKVLAMFSFSALLWLMDLAAAAAALFSSRKWPRDLGLI